MTPLTYNANINAHYDNKPETLFMSRAISLNIFVQLLVKLLSIRFYLFNEYSYIVPNYEWFYKIFVQHLASSFPKPKWIRHYFDVLQCLHDHNFQHYFVR